MFRNFLVVPIWIRNWKDNVVLLPATTKMMILMGRLHQEILYCAMLLKNRNERNVIEPKHPLESLNFLISYGEEVYPNLQTAL